MQKESFAYQDHTDSKYKSSDTTDTQRLLLSLSWQNKKSWNGQIVCESFRSHSSWWNLGPNINGTIVTHVQLTNTRQRRLFFFFQFFSIVGNIEQNNHFPYIPWPVMYTCIWKHYIFEFVNHTKNHLAYVWQKNSSDGYIEDVGPGWNNDDEPYDRFDANMHIPLHSYNH